MCAYARARVCVCACVRAVACARVHACVCVCVCVCSMILYNQKTSKDQVLEPNLACLILNIMAIVTIAAAFLL